MRLLNGIYLQCPFFFMRSSSCKSSTCVLSRRSFVELKNSLLLHSGFYGVCADVSSDAARNLVADMSNRLVGHVACLIGR